MKRHIVLWFWAAILIAGLIAPAMRRAQAWQNQGDRLQVVGSFSILADVIAQVAGEAAEVTALVPLNADPHGFAPSARDLIALAEADVVFVVGAGFEEGLADTISSARDTMDIVVTSDCIAILPFGEVGDHNDDSHEADAHPDGELAALCAAHQAELAALPGDDRDEDDAHGEPLGLLYTLACTGGADAHAEDAEHVHGACDPHVWMDPHNVMLWAMRIRDALIARDPAHADIYTTNAEAYIAALGSLAHDVWLPQLLSVPQANRKLVTNHGSLGYLAHWAGYEVVGLVIPGSSSQAEASARGVANLIDVIRTEGVPAVFAETTTNPDLAEQIAAETGVSFVTLYTGSLSAADGPAATYVDYFSYNVGAITEALSGTPDPGGA